MSQKSKVSETLDQIDVLIDDLILEVKRYSPNDFEEHETHKEIINDLYVAMEYINNCQDNLKFIDL